MLHQAAPDLFRYWLQVGIHGNAHMMMLEKNNLEIAEFIAKWADQNIR